MTLKPPGGSNEPQGTITEPINVVACGAIPNSNSAAAITANNAAFAAAVAALPSGRGSIFVARGRYFLSAFPNLDLRSSIVFYGEGGLGGATASDLIYTGTGAGTFISARSSDGVIFRDLAILHSDASTGTLVDWSALPGQLDTADMRLIDVMMGRTLGAPRGATGMDLSKAILGKFRIKFVGLDIGVIGRKLIGDYSTTHLFEGCSWQSIVTSPVKNIGEAWTFVRPVWQQLVSGNACAIARDPGFYSNGGEIIGGWAGDTIPAATGTWINWAGNAFKISMVFGRCAVAINAGSDVSSRGLTVMGCKMPDTSGKGVVLGAGAQNITVMGNSWDDTNPDPDIDISAGVPSFSFLMARRGLVAPLDFQEMTVTPNAPSANNSRLYTRDNGSGKTQLQLRTDSAQNTVFTSA